MPPPTEPPEFRIFPRLASKWETKLKSSPRSPPEHAQWRRGREGGSLGGAAYTPSSPIEPQPPPPALEGDPHPALSLSEWEKGRRGPSSTRAIAPAFRNTTPEGLPLCQASTWRPLHEWTQGPGRIPSSFPSEWALLPPGRSYSPRQGSSFPSHRSQRTPQTRTARRFFAPAGADLYIGRSRFATSSDFFFFFRFCF